MYDETSYYAFVPSALVQTQDEKPRAAKQQRKTSLLAQPDESSQANCTLTGGRNVDGASAEEVSGPPKATLNRRAQSYTDFHHAVRAVLGADSKSAGEPNGKADTEIKNDLDFGAWYQGLEDELLEASHDETKAYLDRLRFTESYLESLSSNASKALEYLAALSDSFQAVDAQTTAFQKQCENLIDEQQRLEGLANDIGENLQFYSFLEPITRKLNAPGAGNFVRGQEFSDMLARLDECLDYMNGHTTQREAPTYGSRYRLLLTRGLTLIRMHFAAALRDIAQDVGKRIADKQLNDTTMSTLLYAKFRVGASDLKEVAQEIRKRAVLPTGAEPGAEVEYQSLMNEMYTAYSATRGKLVLPLVRKKIGEIAMAPSTGKDLVAFARSSIGYIKDICSDEFDLWREWFEGQDGMYDFLESVCEPLYDHLRPRIIHENQLLKLCELCSLLQTRYFRDQDEEIEEIESSTQLDFTSLIQAALEDAQTRLVFRTQAALRDEIEKFKPKPEDLDSLSRSSSAAVSGTRADGPATSGKKGSMPERTLTLPKTPGIDDEIAAANGNFGFDIESSFRGWYPTLRKAIWLLSRIYRLVNSTVFDDLAHQIVHQTTLSLHRASTLIATRKTPVDSQLFLLKHLLLLKQQIVAFDIEYVTPDVSFDFSGMTNTFYELRDRGALFDPRTLWRLVGGGGLLPRVVENMLDAKAELDGRLRTVINDFTIACASRMTAPIAEPALSKKGFDAAAAVPAIRAAVGEAVPLLRQKLDEYLDDVRTKETLAGAVQDQVVQTYDAFFLKWAAEQRGRGRPVGSHGKEREREVWHVDVFAEWAAQLFRVEWAGVGRGGDGHADAAGHGGRSGTRSLSDSGSDGGSGGESAAGSMSGGASQDGSV